MPRNVLLSLIYAAATFATVCIGGCAWGPPTVTSNRVQLTEHEDEWTLAFSDAGRSHREQETETSCTAAAMQMVALLEGREPLAQDELIERHQRTLAEIIPGNDDTIGRVREKLTRIGIREDDMLNGWEIQDALVPGRFEALRNEGYVIISPTDAGVPYLPRDLNLDVAFNLMSDKDIAEALAAGIPIVATLTETGDEFFRHAYVIVGLTVPAGKEVASEIQLLDPMADDEVVALSGDEFRGRVRTLTHEERVRADYDFMEKLIARNGLMPGFYVRHPSDSTKIGLLQRIASRKYLDPIAHVQWEDAIGEEAIDFVTAQPEALR